MINNLSGTQLGKYNLTEIISIRSKNLKPLNYVHIICIKNSCFKTIVIKKVYILLHPYLRTYKAHFRLLKISFKICFIISDSWPKFATWQLLLP